MRFLKIFARRPAGAAPLLGAPYEAFTTRFDHIVACGDLDRVLDPLTKEDMASLDEAWALYERTLASLAVDVAQDCRRSRSEMIASR